MRFFSLLIAAAVLVAFVAALQPAAAQQCPKGQTWDYGSQSCK
jgi:hypothetical protein